MPATSAALEIPHDAVRRWHELTQRRASASAGRCNCGCRCTARRSTGLRAASTPGAIGTTRTMVLALEGSRLR